MNPVVVQQAPDLLSRIMLVVGGLIYRGVGVAMVFHLRQAAQATAQLDESAGVYKPKHRLLLTAGVFTGLIIAAAGFSVMEASERQTYADFMESIEKEAGVEIFNKEDHDYDAIKQNNTLPVNIHSDEGIAVDGELVALSGEAVLRVPETLPDTKMVSWVIRTGKVPVQGFLYAFWGA